MQLDDNQYQQLRKALKPFISAKSIYNYYSQQHASEAAFKNTPQYEKVISDLRQTEADWEAAVKKITGGTLNPVLALEINGFPTKKAMEGLIIPPAEPAPPALDTAHLLEILNKTRPAFAAELNHADVQQVIDKWQKDQ